MQSCHFSYIYKSHQQKKEYVIILSQVALLWAYIKKLCVRMINFICHLTIETKRSNRNRITGFSKKKKKNKPRVYLNEQLTIVLSFYQISSNNLNVLVFADLHKSCKNLVKWPIIAFRNN